jgi:hypothetical protein
MTSSPLSSAAAQKKQVDESLDKAVQLISSAGVQLKQAEQDIQGPWKMWQQDLHNTMTRKTLDDGREPRALLSIIDKDFGETYMKAWRAAPDVVKGLERSSMEIEKILPQMKATRDKVRAIQVPTGSVSPSQVLTIKSQYDSAWASAQPAINQSTVAINTTAMKIVKDALKFIRPAIKLMKMLLKDINPKLNKLKKKKWQPGFREKIVDGLQNAKKRIQKFMEQAVKGEKRLEAAQQQLPQVAADLTTANKVGSTLKTSIDTAARAVPSGAAGAARAGSRSIPRELQSSAFIRPDLRVVMAGIMLGGYR